TAQHKHGQLNHALGIAFGSHGGDQGGEGRASTFRYRCYFQREAPPASSIATNADAPAATRTMAFCTRPPETSDLPLGHRCAPYGHVASLQVTRLVVQAEALPSPPRDSVL